MSMKIMQNYQYLMQNPNGSDPNLKNLAFNSIHYQNCICKRFEGSDFFDKRLEQSNAFNKRADDSIQGKEPSEMSDAFNKMREVSEAANKRLGAQEIYTNRVETPVNYKKHNPDYSKRNEATESSVAFSKETSESNLYNKTISDNISAGSRSEIANMYSGFETADVYARREVSKLYGKEIGNPNFFPRKNVNLGLFKKYSYLKQNEISNSFLKRAANPEITGTTMQNSNIPVKRHENNDIYDKRVENSNLQDKRIENENMYAKKVENSELFSKNAEINDACSKSEFDIHTKSLQTLQSLYCDEDLQASLARKQLLAHSSTKLNLCDVCKKSFSTKGNLHNHHIVHSGHKPHECAVCKKTFSQRSTLGKHYLIHTGEKPHICSVCGRGFRQANNLRIHFLTHSGEKPHICNICDRAFTQKIALQKHMLTHTGMKPHECDVCNRCFTTKGNLQKHFLTHTGEKPHICNICNRGFSQKIALKKHHLTHTGEKPHICSMCGKGFTTKGNLKSHFKRHTREKSCSSLSQSISSSIAQTLLVPKSIAQSIMSPISVHTKEFSSLVPNSVPTSSSVPSSLAESKSVLPLSSHIQHPLALVSPVTSAVSQQDNVSTMTQQSFNPPKSRVASYYTTPNQHYSLSSSTSHTLSSVPFPQPQNLTASSHLIPIFHSPTLTITSSHPSFTSQLQSNDVPPSTMQSHITQTSDSLNTLSSHLQKPVFASSQQSRPSLPKAVVHSISCKEPMCLTTPDSPPVSVEISNVRPITPLAAQCSVSLSANAPCDEMKNTVMSKAQGHNIPTTLSQNLSAQTSQAAENNKIQHQHITIL